MPIKHIIKKGFGAFGDGVIYIPTHGFTPGAAAALVIAARNAYMEGVDKSATDDGTAKTSRADVTTKRGGVG